MRSIKLFAGLLTLALTCYPSHHRHKRSQGQSGDFDFYMLVLSWSPEFCYSRPTAEQCSKHAGFLVHGLWPQNNDGSYPSNCATSQPPPTNPSAMADIMPQEIIEHEWQTHGTCSGLSGDAYFALIRKAFESVRIPSALRAPTSSFATGSAQIKRAFEQANPNLNDANIDVQVHQRYLNAVDICLAHGLTPTAVACSGLPSPTGSTFIVPPVR